MIEISGSLVAAVLRGISDAIKIFSSINSIAEDDLSQKIETHLSFVEGWSSQLQFMGLPEPKDVSSSTISTRLHRQLRRFGRSEANTPALGEDEILADNQNYIILGDPGSGKTTSLKRLAQALLHSAPTSPKDFYQYPIVLILREIPRGRPLIVALADAVGITYEIRQKDANAELLGGYYTRSTPLEAVVYDFLRTTKPVLFIDGIDEVHSDDRPLIEIALTRIALSAPNTKVVATCRSGDYAHQIDGFRLVEIAALDTAQSRSIVAQWAGDPDGFLRAATDSPYQDLLDRPLFLTQLITVFNNSGYLPDRPAEVYRRISMLMLERWDQERRVLRHSRYAGFEADRKLDFLSSLAFELTYRIKRKSFSNSDLITAYLTICDRFQLSRAAADQVCSEIESHNGLMVESANGFEFSHLSLQEYLAAYHIVRQPFSVTTLSYLHEYPAPIAIATSISSDPSAWFAALISVASDKIRLTRKSSLISLISRIILERPSFSISRHLGQATLVVIQTLMSDLMLQSANFLYPDPAKNYDLTNITFYTERFLSIPNVGESVQEFVALYEWQSPVMAADIFGPILLKRAARDDPTTRIFPSSLILGRDIRRMLGEFINLHIQVLGDGLDGQQVISVRADELGT